MSIILRQELPIYQHLECVEIGDLLEDHPKMIEYKRVSTAGPKYQKSSSRMVNEKKK